MTFALLFVPMLLYAYVDGSSDFLSVHRGHHDLWHALKYLSRLLLLYIGSRLTMLDWTDIGFESKWFNGLVGCAYIVVYVLIIKIAVWDVAFRSQRNRTFMSTLDDCFKVSTGVKWMDRFLGFHQ